jgi:hypothetical protein
MTKTEASHCQVAKKLVIVPKYYSKYPAKSAWDVRSARKEFPCDTAG